MKFSHIHFIINPASGKEEPILSYINNVFADSGIDWDISVTKKGKDTGDMARSLIGKTDLVAVYGGDGSVTEVAAALHGSDTPMALIPGGTANVMAKELGIPLESPEALQLIADGNYIIQGIDMGTMNGCPFLLRVSLGIMADMVLQTDNKLKGDLGQLAYGVTALKTFSSANAVKYSMNIDGVAVEDQGVALTVTNSGHAGIGDLGLQPGISITDGLLDVLLLREADLTSFLKVVGSSLLQSETDAIRHWKCKEVTIWLEQEQRFICDDHEALGEEITIKVAPASIKILIPAQP